MLRLNRNCRFRLTKVVAGIFIVLFITGSYYHHEIMLFTQNYTPYHTIGYSYSEEALPKIPPENHAPIVLLHTYMRGGSSLLGSIFDRNPYVLYYFEPLYTLYQAAMNTEHYKLQPLHVYAYPNGTSRDTTNFEDNMVFDRLFDLFDCKMDKLRMEHIANAFISRSQALRPYERCMGTFTIAQRNYCTTLNAKYCGGFVSETMKNKCHVFMAMVLNDTEALRFIQPYKLKEPFPSDFVTEKEYKSCLKDVYVKHNKCENIYRDRCEFAHLKVAKLVRSNVRFLGQALRYRNDVFVIYQPRDPRGMLSSKKSLNFLTFDLEKEAKLECKLLSNEYQEMLKLKQSYPRQVMILRYEDLAENPIYWAEQVYQFVNINPPKMVFDSLKSSMSSFQPFDIRFSTSRNDGKKAAWSWKNTMSEEDRHIVEKACEDFFDFNIYDF